jgi:hypothetical protein
MPRCEFDNFVCSCFVLPDELHALVRFGAIDNRAPRGLPSPYIGGGGSDMSFLSSEEAAALRIRRMILHVVGEVEFQPEPELAAIEQEQFFLDRLHDVNASGLFVFTETSATKAVIGEMAVGKILFEAGAQALSREFAKQHVGASIGGAFFIFELSAGIFDTHYYGMLKIDYKPAIERIQTKGGTRLRAIVEALVEDKKALQKSCLVRVTDGVVLDEISAKDRMGVSPNLTDYFAKFLDVRRNRSDEELNRDLSESLRQIFNETRDVLPGHDIGLALAKAKDALRSRSVINEDVIVEAVLLAAGDPQNEDYKDRVRSAIASQIKKQKLSGLAFKPDPQVLRRSQRRRLKTAEGILLEYPTDLENASVRRDSRPDGSATIVIETKRVEDDEIVRERTGRKN